MNYWQSVFCISTLCMAVATPAHPHDQHHHGNVAPSHLRAQMQNKAEDAVGTVELQQGAGGTLAQINVSNLPSGWHAIHLHETGKCEAESFKSAGGHVSADTHQAHFGKEHGFLAHETHHMGDMPNIWIHEDGTAKVDYFLNHLHITDLMDQDGAAIIIHASADDYRSQPRGAAGARIACGVLKDATQP